MHFLIFIPVDIWELTGFPRFVRRESELLKGSGLASDRVLKPWRSAHQASVLPPSRATLGANVERRLDKGHRSPHALCVIYTPQRMHPVKDTGVGRMEAACSTAARTVLRSVGVKESGSVGEPGRWAPIPWQELVDPLCGVIMQPCEHIGEPSLRIDVVELCGLD